MLQVHSDQWHKSVKSLALLYKVNPRRWGMRATVYLGTDAGDYVMSYGLNSTQLSDNANWLKVADIGAAWGTGGAGATNVWKYQPDFNASVNALPGDASTLKYQTFYFTTAGTMPDTNVWPEGTIAVALVDNPGQTMANWRLI